MLRVIFFFLCGVLVFLALRRWLQGSRRPPTPSNPPPGPASSLPSPQTMVACAHCGILMPASEALGQVPHTYCSAAHQQAGPSKPPPTGEDRPS
jgi:uncharacterized protein